MENIRFASKEHETFYYNMLKAVRSSDVFRKAFFYTMGISAETRNHITSLFDFGESLIKRRGFRLNGRPEVQSAYAGLHLTCGTAGQRKARNNILHRITYLTAALY